MPWENLAYGLAHAHTCTLRQLCQLSAGAVFSDSGIMGKFYFFKGHHYCPSWDAAGPWVTAISELVQPKTSEKLLDGSQIETVTVQNRLCNPFRLLYCKNIVVLSVESKINGTHLNLLIDKLSFLPKWITLMNKSREVRRELLVTVEEHKKTLVKLH